MDYVVEVRANSKFHSSFVSNDVPTFDISDTDMSILHVDAACRPDYSRVGLGGVIDSTLGYVKASMYGFRDLSLGSACAEALTIIKDLRIGFQDESILHYGVIKCWMFKWTWLTM